MQNIRKTSIETYNFDEYPRIIDNVRLHQVIAMNYCDAKQCEEYIKAYNKAYRQSHKEKAKEYMKKYWKAHKEKHNAFMKSWRDSNLDKYRDYQKDYQKTREQVLIRKSINGNLVYGSV